MKFLHTLILVLMMVLFGCERGTEVSSPAKTDSHSYKLIKLPPKKGGLSVETIFSLTETIDGEKGGEIKLKEEYEAEDGHKVKIKAKLKVKKYSFTGVVDITLTVDNQFAAASFSPPMDFVVPLEFEMKFEGLDLENMNLTTGDYDFVFIEDDGSFEVVGYNNLHVNEDKGKIWVNKALLNHFSRYGFVN